MTEEQDSYFTKGSIIIFLTFIGGFIASYSLNVALAQTLGPMQYGDYKVAEAFISLGGIVVLMGGGNAVARFLPKQINGNREGVWDYTRFYSVIIIAATVVLTALVIFGHELHAVFNEDSEYHPILLACLAIPFVAFTALFGGILQVAKRLDLAFIPWRVGYPGGRLLIGIIYFLLVGNISLYEAVLITVLAAMLVSGFCLYKVRHLALMPIKPVTKFCCTDSMVKSFLSDDDHHCTQCPNKTARYLHAGIYGWRSCRWAFLGCTNHGKFNFVDETCDICSGYTFNHSGSRNR